MPRKIFNFIIIESKDFTYWENWNKSVSYAFKWKQFSLLEFKHNFVFGQAFCLKSLPVLLVAFLAGARKVQKVRKAEHHVVT